MSECLRGADLKLDLKEIFNNDKTLDFNYNLDLSAVDFNSVKPFKEPASIAGNVKSAAGVVEVDYKVDCIYDNPCDRCLCETKQDLSYRFSHILVNMVYTDDFPDNYIICENGVLDLDELAIGDILLDLPTVFLCSDKCKGLCQYCGTDLNEKDCGCTAEKNVEKSPFSSLKSLLD